MALTDKQRRFVDEYLVDLNATQAAIRAGYSKKTAYSQAERLLRNVEVARGVQDAQAQRSSRVQADADYVLRRLVEIDQMDVLDIMTDDMSLKPVSEWPLIWRQYLSGFDLADMFEGRGEDREMVGILKKIKWPDKVKNLELLGRHVGVRAFREQVEHTGKNGGPMEFATLSKEEYRQARREMLANDDC
ncbi:terminase small subunit [Achromobacter xylosoxidans]|uniref:terminase small subunit n=1 Tax=Alcaligenes xylosoxydans xylosoxydans TaxID=85698 RepID=UPI001EECF5FE|nr:terminase small subunit [Achromobacter xylosoxidans]